MESNTLKGYEWNLDKQPNNNLLEKIKLLIKKILRLLKIIKTNELLLNQKDNNTINSNVLEANHVVDKDNNKSNTISVAQLANEDMSSFAVPTNDWENRIKEMRNAGKRKMEVIREKKRLEKDSTKTNTRKDVWKQWEKNLNKANKNAPLFLDTRLTEINEKNNIKNKKLNEELKEKEKELEKQLMELEKRRKEQEKLRKEKENKRKEEEEKLRKEEEKQRQKIEKQRQEEKQRQKEKEEKLRQKIEFQRENDLQILKDCMNEKEYGDRLISGIDKNKCPPGTIGGRLGCKCKKGFYGRKKDIGYYCLPCKNKVSKDIWDEYIQSKEFKKLFRAEFGAAGLGQDGLYPYKNYEAIENMYKYNYDKVDAIHNMGYLDYWRNATQADADYYEFHKEQYERDKAEKPIFRRRLNNNTVNYVDPNPAASYTEAAQALGKGAMHWWYGEGDENDDSSSDDGYYTAEDEDDDDEFFDAPQFGGYKHKTRRRRRLKKHKTKRRRLKKHKIPKHKKYKRKHKTKRKGLNKKNKKTKKNISR